MAQQIINVGSMPNDGTGDKLRDSQKKANANFTELYLATGSVVQSVTGDSVDNTDPSNPIVNAIPLSGTSAGNPITGDIELDNTKSRKIQGIVGNFIEFAYDGSIKINESSSSPVYVQGIVVEASSATASVGISGTKDYTPNITDLDYTQKKYVDNAVNTATNTATVTVELVNSLSTDFYAPDDLRINTTNTIFGVGTITLKVNDVAYTLTDLIIKGDKITVETNSESVFNLDIIYE